MIQQCETLTRKNIDMNKPTYTLTTIKTEIGFCKTLLGNLLVCV